MAQPIGVKKKTEINLEIVAYLIGRITQRNLIIRVLALYIKTLIDPVSRINTQCWQDVFILFLESP